MAIVAPRADSDAEVDLTQLPDIELYRKARASVPTRTVAGQPALRQRIHQLSAIFEGQPPATVALALFGAYAARISENGEAAFVVNEAKPGQAPACGVLTVGVGPKERFQSILLQCATFRMRSQLPGLSAAANIGDGTAAPIVFSLGDETLRAHGDMHIHCDDEGNLTWTCRGDIGREAMAVIEDRMTALAGAIAANPDKPLVRQEIMSARERNRLLRAFNDTAVSYAYDGGLVGAMERMTASCPQHPAVIFKGETIDFGEFNRRANRLARYLREQGVGRDRFVCLLMDRSVEMVVAIWATLKAGGAYVPLNTDDPASRIGEIIADSQPRVVITQSHLAEKTGAQRCPVLEYDDSAGFAPERDDADLKVDIQPGDLAYMIYTSGSTGKPKGVIVEHGAIHNRVVWMHEEYGLEPGDRVLQKTPYTFDVSVWEFLWSFAVGSTLVVAEPGGHMAMGYMKQLIKKEQVTHLHFVPSVFRLFLMHPDLSDLKIKKLFCSGEALGADIVARFYEKANAEAEVHNLYGPTEAAVDVSYFHCPRDNPSGVIPIGRPVANTGLYVLDEYDQPTPIGVPGELHIGGVQLARGYWAREELTAERFIAAPLEDIPCDRLYRTGDLAYFRPDGEIVYLGRNDFQVKINGVRIELGEIEAAIREVPGIADVVVVAEESQGNKVLIAYVVTAAPSPEKEQAIKHAVASTRPPHYVPREVRFLAELPLTASGKTDRKRLAAMPRL